MHSEEEQQKIGKSVAARSTGGHVIGHRLPENEKQGKVKDQGGGRNPLAQTRRPLQSMQLFKPYRSAVRI